MPDTSARSKKHVHGYMRVMGKFSYIWKCRDPHCTHFIHQSQEHYLITRATYCFNCQKQFVIDEETVEECEEQMMCLECRRPDTTDYASIAEIREKQLKKD